MRAVVCHKLGPVSDVAIEDVPLPELAPDQVRIAVEAAGVSYVDALLVGGRYQFPVAVPFIPGGEVVGLVQEVGADAARFVPGERVVAQTGVGGFAEVVCANHRHTWHLPEGISPPIGATVLQSYTTAVYALTRRDPLHPGEKVLVLGAGGGVGLAAIDVATALGAHAIAVASSPEKRAAAVAAGAVAAIDPVTEDVKARARELSGGGVDVVIDPVGGDLAEPALRALAFGGRYHVVGFASGSIPSLPLNLVLLNSRSVVGVELGGVLRRSPDLGGVLALEVLSGVASGVYRPADPVILGMEDAGAGLEALLERRVTGKLALLPGG